MNLASLVLLGNLLETRFTGGGLGNVNERDDPNTPSDYLVIFDEGGAAVSVQDSDKEPQCTNGVAFP